MLAETDGDAQRAAGLFAEAAGGRAALRDAHALFGRLGAQPLAAEAERLLHATQGDAAQS